MNQISLLELIVLFTAGILSGGINTIAGSGSLFSLGALIWVGIPAHLANTTNRIGVLFQNISGIWAYQKFGKLSLKFIELKDIIFVLLGASLGAIAAVYISAELFKWIIGAVMVLLLFTTLIQVINDNKIFVRTSKNKSSIPVRMLSLIFAGFYGGFLQVGIGIVLLVILEQFSSYTLKEANLVKLLLVLVYTVPTTLFFIIKGYVVWLPALALSGGQMIGGVLAGKFASKNPGADKFIRYLIILMILSTLFRLFWS